MKKTKKNLNHEIIHLIGTKEEKKEIYHDYYCPVKILQEASFLYSNKESYDDIDLLILSALTSNPSTPEDSIILLSESFKKKEKSVPSWLPYQVTRHFTHPMKKKQIIDSLMSESRLKKSLHEISNNNAQLYLLVTNNCFLSGGSIGDVMFHENLNDLDFFFKDTNSAVSFLKHALSLSNDESIKNTQLKVGTDSVEVDSKTIKFDWNSYSITITNNAITFVNKHLPHFEKAKPLQFITKIIGAPDVVISSFDFAHCKMFYDIKTDYLSVTSSSYISRMKKHLVFDGGTNPVNALLRVEKFKRRGWKIAKLEFLKIALAISQLDLSNPKVLRDSINGLYSDYLSGFFEKKIRNNENITIQDLNILIYETMKSLK